MHRRYAIPTIIICLFVAAAVLHSGQTAEAPPIVKEAQHQADCGEWRKAINLYNEALRQYPNNAVYLARRGSARAQIGDYKEAYTDFSAAIQSDAKCPEAYGRRSLTYSTLGLRTASKQDAQKALTLWTSSQEPKRLMQHANLLEIIDKDEAAVEEYKHVLSLLKDQKDIGSLQTVAGAHFSLHQYKECVDRLNQAIKLSGCSSLLLLRSAAYGKSSIWRLASEDIDQYINANPQDPVGFNIRGYLLFNQGNIQDAVTSYSQAICYEPNFPYALHWRGRAYHDLECYKEAIQDFTSAIHLDATDFCSLAERSHCYWHQKEWKKAIADGQKSVALNPKYGRSYICLASALDGAGLFTEAIDSYSKAIALDPQSASGYYSRGMCNRDHKHYKEAITDITDAIKYDPQNAMYYCARGSALVSDHQYEKAIADCTQSLKLNSTRIHPHLSRGIAYARLGKSDQALQDFDDAIRHSSNYGEAYYERSLVSKALGKTVQSELDLKKAKQFGYKSPEDMR